METSKLKTFGQIIRSLDPRTGHLRAGKNKWLDVTRAIRPSTLGIVCRIVNRQAADRAFQSVER